MFKISPSSPLLLIIFTPGPEDHTVSCQQLNAVAPVPAIYAPSALVNNVVKPVYNQEQRFLFTPGQEANVIPVSAPESKGPP